MKVTLIGVKRMKGIGKDSGNPYDITRAICLAPIENMSGEKMTITGFGFEVAEVSLDPEALPAFGALKFPCQVKLEMEPRPYRGKLEMFVVGFEQLQPAQVKAA